MNIDLTDSNWVYDWDFDLWVWDTDEPQLVTILFFFDKYAEDQFIKFYLHQYKCVYLETNTTII